MEEKIQPKAEENETWSDESVIYELGYHVLSSVGDEQIHQKTADFKSLLEKHHGVFISEGAPTLTRLAYTIVKSSGGKREKYDTTYFGWIKFEVPLGSIQKIQEELERIPDMLRFLIIRTVREDTRIPYRVTANLGESKEPPKSTILEPNILAPKPKPTPQMSDDELDRTIEELVVE